MPAAPSPRSIRVGTVQLCPRERSPARWCTEPWRGPRGSALTGHDRLRGGPHPAKYYHRGSGGGPLTPQKTTIAAPAGDPSPPGPLSHKGRGGDSADAPVHLDRPPAPPPPRTSRAHRSVVAVPPRPPRPPRETPARPAPASAPALAHRRLPRPQFLCVLSVCLCVLCVRPYPTAPHIRALRPRTTRQRRPRVSTTQPQPPSAPNRPTRNGPRSTPGARPASSSPTISPVSGASRIPFRKCPVA
jgi:hypothetical protein